MLVVGDAGQLWWSVRLVSSSGGQVGVVSCQGRLSGEVFSEAPERLRTIMEPTERGCVRLQGKRMAGSL